MMTIVNDILYTLHQEFNGLMIINKEPRSTTLSVCIILNNFRDLFYMKMATTVRKADANTK